MPRNEAPPGAAARRPPRGEAAAGGGRPRAETPDDVLDRCRRYLAERVPLKALKALAEYCRDHPDDPEGHRLRAEARIAVGDRAGALEALVEALRYGGRAFEPSLVRFLVEGGLYEEADALVEARLSEGHDPARWLAIRAHVALAAGRYLEAQEAIDRLRALPARAAGAPAEPPVRAADYIQALLWAALGDARRLGGLLEHLEARGAPAVHVEFVRAALRLLEGGDVEAFLERCETTAAALLRGGRSSRGGGAAAEIAAILRSVRPDWFRPPRAAERARLRLYLMCRIPEAEVSGLPLDSEEVDLVRDVFPGAAHVRLGPIAGPDAGRSGDRVMRAAPEYPGLREHSSLVKIGPKHRIALERLRLERYVVGRLHPRHYPAPRGYAATLRRAALRSTWAVPDHEEVVALRGLYAAPPDRDLTERLEALLEGLVGEVLRPWYVENAEIRPASPAAVYRLESLGDTVDRALRDLGVEAAGDRLAIEALGPEWWPPDPRPRLAAALETAGREVPVWFGVIHGDLNLRNVLVGRGGAGDVASLCLIDFYKTAPGPVLADVARLEADLRHDADSPPEGETTAEAALRDERAYLDVLFIEAAGFETEPAADYRLSVERRYRAVRAVRRAAAAAARAAGALPSRAEHLAALAAATAPLLFYESLGRARRCLALAALARTVAALAGG